MKRALLVLLLLTLGGVIGRYGPAGVSFVLIPPERGVFRGYENYDSSGPYWGYLMIRDGYLVCGSFRENAFRETWEIVPGSGTDRFLYDYRSEFDGALTLTKTAMVISDIDGKERRYPRVLDLWEIWRDKTKTADASPLSPVYQHLAEKKDAYSKMIARRMKEQGLSVSPAADAQKRPPARRLAVASISSQVRPLLAVTEFGAWNATGTVFALYADGTAICRSEPENDEIPYHASEIADVPGLLSELVPAEFAKLAPRYEMSGGTDQMTTTLWVAGKTVQIYGRWQSPRPRLAENEDPSETERRIDEHEAEMRRSLPAALRDMLEKIDVRRKTQGQPWLPSLIEVQLSTYEHGRNEPVVWPKEWPGLYHATSKKHSADIFSVFVPSADFAKLRALLPTDRSTGAVMIDLNRMAPTVRFPFPGEVEWLK